MTRQHIQWEASQARLLVGATIHAIIKTSDSEAFGLKVQLANGDFRSVWIECDPEGNGPGHLAIEKPDTAQITDVSPALAKS